MAWTAPITFAAGSTLTAAQLNTYLRDNMLEQGPAIVTATGQYLLSDGANSLAAYVPAQSTATADVSTTSSTYVTLGSSTPSVTLTTGTRAIVTIAAGMSQNTDNLACYASYAISGATTTAASDSWSIHVDGVTGGNFCRFSIMERPALTAGSNTFTMRYNAGGSGGTATFRDRQIAVIPF